MAAQAPFPLTGVLLDTDGSTPLVGATALAINTTNDERTSVTTAEDGSFSVDMANFTTDYANGNKIQVLFYYGNGKSCWRRYTLDTVEGAKDFGNITIHWGKYYICSDEGYETLLSGVLSNSSSGCLYADFYDVTNDNKIMRIEVGGAATEPAAFAFNFGHIGKRFKGGICIIREDETADYLEVTLVVR